MAEKEQVRPLAPATADHPRSDQDYPSSDRVLPIDEEAPTSKWSSSKKLHNKRWILCCGCCTAIVLILSIIVLVLVLTVFQIKDPNMTLNSVRIDGMSPTLASLNVTLIADISIKNPNVASFKFGNSTTVISYDDRTIGEGLIPPGKAPARRTIRMNVTVDVLASQLLGDANILRDLALGNVTVNSYTKMGGRVNLLNIFKKHADVIMNCTVTMSVFNQTILEQNCKRKVKM
ncbi:hypothetical protein MRB53_030107 [Persea americana]|uniref:Uncharacterized protein n=1 Tax=Persea americana TaxID=3435 RepID=A0ACC2KKE1_PERAE|nr:hypothetical protein MRB53_030107 [Persea americana]|eukprot:TRINITY_DN92549_c0_g1_i1.p1 TRINITY_DN92549_c0_g1~~TRINITY_DN92549_c0_g1_i1.p1  ORF type:complete len:232 (-),score=26.42 TRINITY_DN92549_c0_g1_i1:178-873(-)